MKLMAVSAVTLGLAALAPSNANAQTLKCFDAESGTSGAYVAPDAAQDPGFTDLSGCDGSVNTFVENDMSIIGLTVPEKIKKAVEVCGLANGPYRRKASGAPSATVDPRLDYVTVNFSPPGSSSIPSISNQIGIDPGVALQVTATGSSSSNAATFDLIDISTNEEGELPSATIIDGVISITGASQIADLPGFDFAYFEKSSGNADATLICDHRMWFDDGTVKFGIASHTFDHNVNQITVGWAMGPSSFGTQGNADAACNVVNLDVTLEAPQAGSGNDSREKYAGILGGFYKTLAEQPDPPVNVTSCAPTETDPRIGHAFHCDDTEVAGHVNSCNPGAGALSGGLTGVSIGAVGEGTDFYFGGSGTPTGGSF